MTLLSLGTHLAGINVIRTDTNINCSDSSSDLGNISKQTTPVMLQQNTRDLIKQSHHD